MKGFTETRSARDADAGGRSAEEVETTLAAPAGGFQERSRKRAEVFPWWELDRRAYRAALRKGVLQPGTAIEQPLIPGRATVIFIHGGRGTPGQFAALAGALRGRANLGAFLYDDTARLAPASGLLREGVLSLPAPVVIVAFSIGTLLPGYIGATDSESRLRAITAVYINPLIGGSRYADADSALALLGDVPGLCWLHGVKRAAQRAFFPSIVQDLTPEGDFQQAIFGFQGRAPSFAAGTTILFTERPGEEPDIRAERVPKFFGRSRREIIERMGRVVPWESGQRIGHAAVLASADLVMPVVMAAIDGAVVQTLARAGR